MEPKISLLRQQGPMLKVLGQVISGALLSKVKKPGYAHPIGEHLTSTVDPISNEVVDAFVKWLGVDRYKNTIPAHFFPQWSIPLAFELGKNHPYPLLKVINQGCSLKIHKDINRGQELFLDGVFVEAKKEQYKDRLHQRVVTKNDKGETLIEADIHSVFLTGRGPKKDKKPFVLPSGAKKIGSWKASSVDGRNYGIISGDLNPIHWIGVAAKLSGFPNKILHGFATFSKTYETLVDGGFNPTEIDIKFLSPVVLPSEVNVYVVEGESNEILVTNKKDTKLHLNGTFK